MSISESGVVSEDIDLGTFMCNVAVGALSGGYDFGLVGNPTISIKTIRFHLNPDNIGRVEVTKHDNTTLVIGGNPSPRVETWKFKDNEKLTQLLLYRSVSGDRLAGVELRTSQDQHLRISIEGVSPTGVSMPVGTGQWVGLFGNAEKYINNMGFAMRKRPVQ